MKETQQLEKKALVHEHPELEMFIRHLPEACYFEYDAETSKLSCHLALGLCYEAKDESFHPHIHSSVRQMLLYLAGTLKHQAKEIPE